MRCARSWGVVVCGWLVAGCFTDHGTQTGSAGGSTTSATDDATTTPTTTGPTTAAETTEATTCAAGCEAVCGDGLPGPFEECDDGNQDNTDTCTNLCRLPICGDGYLQPGESCDLGPGNADNGGCTLVCEPAACGDGKVQVGVEGCDDNNTADGDGCTSSCQLESCGDGAMDPGEGCDDGNTVDDDDCLNNCQLPVCGDGKVHTGAEACDDGNASDDDECTSECLMAACGDGFIHQGVETCDDGNDLETDDCKGDCTPAECGDGVVAAEATVPEACDDGNQNDMDGCTTMCTTTMQGTCGNKVVEGGEQCDDGNALDDDSCDPMCTRLAFLVFVTSQKYTGALGGVNGADVKCNQLATTAGLPGKYRAWLSAAGAHAADRLEHSTHAYIRVDGVLVADNWVDLVSGDLQAPIDRNEQKAMVGPAPADPCDPISAVWTGTQPNGLGLPQTCSGWTSENMNGVFGQYSKVDDAWTSACQYPCSTAARLYCVEQP